MHRNIIGIFFLILSLMLMGCGGGGGSTSGTTSTGGSSSGPVVTDSLSLSTGSITFSATEFEDVPAPISVTASISGSNTAGITFGTLPGVDALPFWLDVQLGSLVNNSVDADFIIRTTDLPAGNYVFTVRAVTFDSDQNVLDTADLSITYSVTAGTPLSVSPQSVDVVMHFESEPITQAVSVTAGDYEWSAFGLYSNVTPSTGRGSQEIIVEIIPPFEEVVETGMEQDFIDIFPSNSSQSATFLVNYTLFPTLKTNETDLILSAIAGNAAGDEIGINLVGQGLTWSASSDVPWLILPVTSGSIETEDDLINGTEGDDFLVGVDPSSLSAGRHDAIITITAEADQTLEIPVSVEVAAQIVMPSKRGIALSQTGATSQLQSSVDIFTNAERVANWTASSDMAWLSVTPSGTVADVMTVTADPALLLDETFSEAIITLTSPDAEISQSTSIKVGFWKSAEASSETRVAVAERGVEGLIVSDPVRPLAYLNAIESEISIVNVYSGEVENTIIPTADAEGLAISDDGAFLYLLGNQNNEGFIDVVDLETQSIISTWPYPETTPQVVGDIALSFGRISNAPYLFTLAGRVIDAQTGEILTVFGEPVPAPSQVKVNVLCGAVICMDIVTAGFEGARVTATRPREADFAGSDVLLTQSGDRLFVFQDGSLNILDTLDMSVLATADTPLEDVIEGAVLGIDDTLYVTFRNDGFVPTDPSEDMIDPSRFMKIYDLALNELATINFPDDGGGIVPIVNDTALSGDNQRVIYLISDAFPEVGTFSLD